MEIFLVGGAVRDALLGLPVRERDWVVVGSTPEEMERLGYRRVGRDFPVFLHPATHEEYALARTERKVSAGHTGFVCHAGPDVTLAQDLRRRDLTINAMAQTPDGDLIDPLGGAADIAARRLRHVSDAFVEDPLRVFRVARFAAQLGAFDFRVDQSTLMLLRDMCARDLLAELAAERVWQEFRKALATAVPARFVDALADCDGLERWFPEMKSSGVGALLNERASALPGALERFGALGWLLAAAAIDRMCDRLKAPNEFRTLAGDVARHGGVLARWRAAEPAALLDAMKACGALRQPDAFGRTAAVVATCAGVELSELVDVATRVKAMRSESFSADGLSGRALGEALDRARIDLIRAAQA